MGFIWNIYEKSFTPYFARLAPKHKVSRHLMIEKPCNLSSYWQNQRNKNIMRFINRYILQNSKLYYTSILAVALGFELFWKLYPDEFEEEEVEEEVAAVEEDDE